MRQKNDEDHERSSLSAVSWVPLFAALVIIVGGFVSAVLALEMDVLRPKVGDIVVFRAGTQDPDAWQMQVKATRPDGSACAFDPTVMASGGGSLVIEAQENTSPLSYRLHWAGTHTAEGADDCGGAVDATISRLDLQKLANAAGGFGIRDQGATR